MELDALNLLTFVRKTRHVIGDTIIRTKFHLVLRVTSVLNLDSFFMPACEMTLELDSLEEVNEYIDRITTFYDKFQKMPVLEEIETDKDDPQTTRDKTRIMNSAISAYNVRLKKLIAGFYLTDKDYGFFSNLEYSFQRKLSDEIRKIEDGDKFSLYIKLDVDSESSVYKLNGVVYSLEKEVNRINTINALASDSTKEVMDRSIWWHDPSVFLCNAYMDQDNEPCKL